MLLDPNILSGVMQVPMGPVFEPEVLEAAATALRREWLPKTRPRAVVFVPNDLKGFSTGVDRERAVREGSLNFLGRLSSAIDDFFGLTSGYSIPVVTVLSGLVVGAGAEFALRPRCIRLALPDTRLMLPEFGQLELVPGLGGGYLALSQVRNNPVGTTTVIKWLVAGRPLSADQAAALGLLDHIVDVPEVESTTDKEADERARTQLAESIVSRHIAQWLAMLPSRMRLKMVDDLSPAPLDIQESKFAEVAPEGKREIAHWLWYACVNPRPNAWYAAFEQCLARLEGSGLLEQRVATRYGQPAAVTGKQPD